ncbi:MAG: SIMPL domain-containing protein [Patescibacteria group bacterium]
MKNFGEYLLLILAIWLGVFAYAKFGPGLPVSSVVTQKTDLFTVSGEGKVTVVPDVAILNLGMSSRKSTVKAAQTEANTVVNNLTAAIKEFGVNEKDIKTTNFSVYPDYDNSKIVGFNVNINLTVTVRNIDKVNDILDKATALGANSVGGIQFTVDEDKAKELTQEARKKAVDDARKKASELSSAAGMTLGKIVNIQEGTSNRIYPMMAKSADTEIQPGTTDITSSVTLFYETR